ncbi:MAG: HD domain-containing protein [Alsobacter sp.]
MNYLIVIDQAAAASLWHAVPELRANFDLVDVRVPRRTVRTPVKGVIVDVDLCNMGSVRAVRMLLRDMPAALPRLFVCRAGSRREILQAHALEATETLDRPVGAFALSQVLRRWDEAEATAAPRDPLANGLDQAMRIADCILSSGERLDVDKATLEWGAEAMMSAVASAGVRSWIDGVRSYHRPTFRHCMLVNGLAVAFAQGIGLSRADTVQVSLAAMLHDVGKARVPIPILDKPGALDPDEAAIMRLHVGHGRAMVQETGEFDRAVVDVVAHHHEYLDGTGYPHGLKGLRIGDLTRIITIVDIVAALVEDRVYRESLPLEQAMDVLVGMHGKVEDSLATAFRSILLDGGAGLPLLAAPVQDEPPLRSATSR